MPSVSDSLERFSDRVENYVKFRPGYPPEVLRLLRDEMGMTPASVVADIGSGTGISAKVFLKNGNTVYAVEPNDAMRSAAEEWLSEFPRLRSWKGAAEATGLDDGSVDFVTAAQAFHWFERENARKEFLRILKPGGYVVLIWNERQLNTTPFLRDYEQFMLKFADDYIAVRHENIDRESLKAFFQREFRTRVFSNAQELDFDGLLGRVLSSSYMPNESDERFPAMKNELSALVAKHAENGNIVLLYNTAVHYSQF